MKKLVLASGSKTRKDLLSAAGFIFSCILPKIDENEFKNDYIKHNLSTPKELSLRLSIAKAKSIDLGHDYFVIGGDQTLELNNVCLSKVSNRQEALERLKLLRGRAHCLHSSVSLVSSGQLLWSFTKTAYLTMRSDLSDNDLSNYIDQIGASIFESVGCYQFEKLGINLFIECSGDYFTILAMPLLELTVILRSFGIDPLEKKE